MELIEPPTYSIDEIEILVGRKSPSFFDAWRTDEEKNDRRNRNAHTEKFAGRSTLSTCIIKDETNSLEDLVKRDLVFDEYKLYGVFPISWITGDDTYECIVDYMEENENPNS